MSYIELFESLFYSSETDTGISITNIFEKICTHLNIDSIGILNIYKNKYVDYVSLMKIDIGQFIMKDTKFNEIICFRDTESMATHQLYLHLGNTNHKKRVIYFYKSGKINANIHFIDYVKIIEMAFFINIKC